jgi:glutathione S-transferase
LPDIYLHHYPNSPFAEKIRAVLGFKKLAWKSVFQPSIMPKPDLITLTGGYRRIPVLQVGNDVVCDTALICDVLEHLQPAPTLYPSAHAQTSKGAERIIAQWADSTLFWAAMAYNFSPKGAEHFFAGQPPEAGKAFAEDRKAMRAGAARMHPSDATAAYKSYLRRIASMVDDQPFVLGAQPTVADFACYHPLWFTRRIEPIANIFETTPSILAWMDRIAALGHGTVHKSSATESIAACADNTPAKGLFDLKNDVFQDEHGIPLGSQVSITAESFGLEPTEGELVAATRTRYSLRRVDARAGTVHVHFPRVGFVLKAVA